MAEGPDLEGLRGRVEALQLEVDALAEANVRAAELMAELEDARAVTRALERRAEELTLQHRIDQVLAEQRDETSLCTRVLATLGATPGLALEPGRAACLERDGHPVLVASSGALDADVLDTLARAVATTLAEPTTRDDRWLVVPLVGSRGTLGAFGLAGHFTPAWTERWLGLLRSMGRALGGAIERQRMDAERLRMARELERARDEALAASRAKSRFLANMSHELRTPLNAVIGYGEMLRDDAEADGLERYVRDLDKVVRAGRHLLSLISDILDLSKIEAGRVDLRLTRFSVRAMIDDVLATARPLLEKNRNTLVVQIGEEVDEMLADEPRMRQCLLNLLGNAAKFTERGTVTLAVDRIGDRLHFLVRDTGIGVHPDQLDTIFEAFTQADTSSTRKFGGTGLGLAITRALCERMQGSATVRSEEGRGTEFELRIPVVTPEDP